ncbi:MAG: hypothetical protein ACRBI6_01135 [Acidimicrobiales bacterium]
MTHRRTPNRRPDVSVSPLARELWGRGPQPSSLRGPTERLLLEMQKARRPRR